MNAQELRCPACFAPIAAVDGALSKCRYCGATIAIHGVPARAPLVPAGQPIDSAIVLEDVGPNKIEVIRVVREHLGSGLREAKELVERAPCVIADWPGQSLRLVQFRDALRGAGARTR